MASLTGQSISTTYDSLLKLTDNGPITSSFKEITDGLGNSSGVFLKSTGQIKLGNYTTTTSFTGTAAGYLAFTSSGEIITTATPGGISSLNALTASTQTFAVGTSGTDFAISSATSTHTFNLPTASATNRGALSSADWTTFNSKIGGSGTTNTIPKFTGTSALGDSNITDSGTLITLGSGTRINGNIGVNAASTAGRAIYVSTSLTGAVTTYGFYYDGSIQSDVTNNSLIFSSNPTTPNTVFTLQSLNHFNASQQAFGASSVVTNQYGFHATSNLTGATNNYGFYGNIASGTNRWNLYMNGTANNYMAGNLGIGSTSLTGFNIRVQKAIGGAASSYGIYQDCDVATDATSSAWAFGTNLGVTAATTCSEIVHYRAASKTFGAGATITNQYGFAANSTLSGATNNYAFYSSIAAGTGRWNLYMAGTAANYLNGTTLIGSTTDNSTTAKLQVTGGISYQNIINQQGGTTYTLALTDQSKIIEMQNSSPSTLTIPLDSSVNFPIGTEIQVLQFGAGQVTIAATSGVTTRSKSGQLKIANQNTGVTLVKRATNDWYVIGNLTA